MSNGLIIFDFDGTLGDTRRNIVTTMQMTIEELHLPNRSEDECGNQCWCKDLRRDMGKWNQG